MDRAISDLLPQVPQGETRLFEAPIKGVEEERFFGVFPNFEYSPHLQQKTPPDRDHDPRMDIRQGPGVSIFEHPVFDLRFKGPSSKIVDFYLLNSNSYFLSERLTDLIEKVDPGSIDRRPVSIKAKDREVEFLLVMPKRHLEAFDVSRSDVLIADELFGTEWVRFVRFPNGAVFDEERLRGIENFTDLDNPRWFWSRKLIDAAKEAGIRGLVTMRPGTVSGGH